jgi:CRISPR-associated protein Cas1
MNNPMLVSGVYSTISVSHRKLIIENKLDHVHVEFFPHQCPHDLLVLGSPRGIVTLEALRWCSKQGIMITLLNWNGNLLSTILPRDTISAKLKLQQYKKCLDSKAKYHIASTVLDAKIGKSLELLLKLADYYPILDKNEIKQAFDDTKISFKHSSELLTLEGNIAIVYWNQLKKLFDVLAPNLNFTNRNGRVHSWNMSASDPINATLNYAYSIVESEVRKSLNSIGLDPSIGFLHETRNGRDSLVYDIQELYRWLADLSVLHLLEDGLKQSDFLVTENYHMRLKPATAKRLVEKIKINFNTRTYYKGLNSTSQSILYDQVRLLANYLMDKQATLEFNMPEIQIKRNDETELRNKILAITPEQQRKLGLRRNTLWYVQKNIREGKKIKIYNKVMSKIS